LLFSSARVWDKVSTKFGSRGPNSTLSSFYHTVNSFKALSLAEFFITILPGGSPGLVKGGFDYDFPSFLPLGNTRSDPSFYSARFLPLDQRNSADLWCLFLPLVKIGWFARPHYWKIMVPCFQRFFFKDQWARDLGSPCGSLPGFWFLWFFTVWNFPEQQFFHVMSRALSFLGAGPRVWSN